MHTIDYSLFSRKPAFCFYRLSLQLDPIYPDQYSRMPMGNFNMRSKILLAYFKKEIDMKLHSPQAHLREGLHLEALA